MQSLAVFRDSIGPQSIGVHLLLVAFAGVTLWYVRRWWVLEHGGGSLGNALPCLTEALIFVAIVTLDITVLALMIAAAVLGAWGGAGLVARAPRRAIQVYAAALMLLSARREGRAV